MWVITSLSGYADDKQCGNILLYLNVLNHTIETSLLFSAGAQETDGEELEGVWHKNVINHTSNLLPNTRISAYYVISVQLLTFTPERDVIA